MDTGIEVVDGATRGFLHIALERCLELRVRRRAASRVLGGLSAVAVHVHVGKGAGTVQEDCLARDGLLAVGPIWITLLTGKVIWVSTGTAMFPLPAEPPSASKNPPTSLSEPVQRPALALL